MKKRAKLQNVMISILTAAVIVSGTTSTFALTQMSDANTQTVAFTDASALSGNFNVYHGEAAMSTGLSDAEPGDYFKVQSRAVKHTCTSTGSHTTGDFKRWDAQDDVVTTALYNKQLYRNFEMSLEIKGPNDWQVLPKLIFGVENPHTWKNKEGGGYTVFLYNEGTINLSGVIDGDYSVLSDSTNHQKKDEFISLASWATVKLRVVDKKVTVTVKQGVKPDYTYDFTLADDYYGGRIGFAAGSGECQFRNFSVTDLGGTVETRPPKQSIKLGNAESMKSFDCYYTDNTQNGFTAAADYSDYWEHPDESSIWRTASSVHAGEIAWDTQKYVSGLVYNVRQFKNFELTVTLQRKESGNLGYMFPGVVFGITDPTKFVDSKGGGNMVYATAEGGLCYWGTDYGSSLMECISSAPAGYSRETPHTLKITVKYGMITVKLTGAGENPASFTRVLPENYTGGYIALVGMANVCGFSDLSINEVDGELTNVTIAQIVKPETIKTGTAVLPGDLGLPDKVKVIGSDNNEYELDTDWDTSSYNRFTRGEYTLKGTFSPKVDNDRHTRIIIEDNTALIKVVVDGESDLAPIKIACVGDSITYGSGTDQAYPVQMQNILGGKYDVRNFGVDGATLLKAGDIPYTYSTAYSESLVYEPNIVVIMLGTNDSKVENWTHKNDFAGNYRSLIEEYRTLPSAPTVYIALSPTVAATNYGISDAIVSGEIVPLQKEIAQETGCKIIDINSFTSGNPSWYSDGVHPTREGYGYIAKEIGYNVMLPGPLEEFNLNRSSDYLFIGEQQTYYECFRPAVITGDTTVVWTSTDPSVAVVTDGTVKAKSKGKTTIKAVCQGKTATMELTVYAVDDEFTIPLTDDHDLKSFDCYYADDALKGLQKQTSYIPYWSVSGAGTARTSNTVGMMQWGDTYVSSLLFNKRQFHNFELTVEIQRNEVGEYNYPMVVFGIKDPTKYMTGEGGGIAAFATAEGTPVISGQVENRLNEWIAGSEPAAGYSREGTHTVKITVEYNTVTFSLFGKSGESVPQPLVCELGDTDMDGYIALVGKANICRFKNLTIRELTNNDSTRVDAQEIITDAPDISVGVGTDSKDITQLPSTVQVRGNDQNTYTANVYWDFDGYNRYKRGAYTISGRIKDSLVGNHVKLYANQKTLNARIIVSGEKDLTDSDTVRLDFNGVSEIKNNFECYYSSVYSNALNKSNPLETWQIADQKLCRIDNNFGMTVSGGWTLEKSMTEMSSLVYSQRKYKNFELEVDFQRGATTFYWAMVGFGIKDPTKYVNQEGGGVLGYFEQEGRPMFWSSVCGTGAHTTPFKAFGYNDTHHLKLVVTGGVATMTIDDREPSYSVLLSQDVQGEGYISLITNANAATFDNLMIHALPDDGTMNEEGFDASAYPQLQYMGISENSVDSYTYLQPENTAKYPSTGEDSVRLRICMLVSLVSFAYLASIGFMKYLNKKGEVRK